MEKVTPIILKNYIKIHNNLLPEKVPVAYATGTFQMIFIPDAYELLCAL